MPLITVFPPFDSLGWLQGQIRKYQGETTFLRGGGAGALAQGLTHARQVFPPLNYSPSPTQKSCQGRTQNEAVNSKLKPF